MFSHLVVLDRLSLELDGCLYFFPNIKAKIPKSLVTQHVRSTNSKINNMLIAAMVTIVNDETSSSSSNFSTFICTSGNDNNFDNF